MSLNDWECSVAVLLRFQGFVLWLTFLFSRFLYKCEGNVKWISILLHFFKHSHDIFTNPTLKSGAKKTAESGTRTHVFCELFPFFYFLFDSERWFTIRTTVKRIEEAIHRGRLSFVLYFCFMKAPWHATQRLNRRRQPGRALAFSEQSTKEKKMLWQTRWEGRRVSLSPWLDTSFVGLPSFSLIFNSVSFFFSFFFFTFRPTSRSDHVIVSASISFQWLP